MFLREINFIVYSVVSACGLIWDVPRTALGYYTLRYYPIFNYRLCIRGIWANLVCIIYIEVWLTSNMLHTTTGICRTVLKTFYWYYWWVNWIITYHYILSYLEKHKFNLLEIFIKGNYHIFRMSNPKHSIIFFLR